MKKITILSLVGIALLMSCMQANAKKKLNTHCSDTGRVVEYHDLNTSIITTPTGGKLAQLSFTCGYVCDSGVYSPLTGCPLGARHGDMLNVDFQCTGVPSSSSSQTYSTCTYTLSSPITVPSGLTQDGVICFACQLPKPGGATSDAPPAAPAAPSSEKGTTH